MHFYYSLHTLAVLNFAFALAQPAYHKYQHHHRRDIGGVDWNNPNLYKDVDWSKINYGGGAPAPAPPTQTPGAAPPVDSSVPAPPASSAPVASSAAPAPIAQKEDNAQKPTSASSSPSAPAPSTGSAGGTTTGGSKRGLAFNPTSPNLSVFNSFAKLTWAHNWDSSPFNLPAKYLYVPTLFSTLPVHTQQWDANAKAATNPSGPTYLMSFNEPDMPLPQASMSVASAVAAWIQYMKPHASSTVKLGSPSISNGVGTNPTTGQPQGLDWLTPFLKSCLDCPIAFVPVHWYGCTNGCSVADDVAAFKKHVSAAMEVARSPVDGSELPVWIPEFQCFGDAEGFLGEVLPWLDGEGRVERYAYFMVREGILVEGGGVSGLGRKFAG